MSGSVKPIINADEAMILMLYLRDTRTATIANLQEIQMLLTTEEKELHGMTALLSISFRNSLMRIS